MNTFVNRFSTTSAASEIRKTRLSLTEDDDDFTDASWGSQAGFATLAHGVPSFTIPDVADVSVFLSSLSRGSIHTTQRSPLHS
jgi:20S proteasome subunit beta 5